MDGFTDLYREYANDVYRFALWLSGDSMEAEDIAAETFAKALVRFRSIEMETVRGYLFKIARNVFLARRGRADRELHLEQDYADHSQDPENQTRLRLTLAWVEGKLKKLPECDRTAFILRVRYDFSYEEIARLLEVSEVNARVKVHRIRKRILQDWTEVSGSVQQAS
jgi:RNA polymerase sigma-70 factor (ECF subfamily)